MISSSDAFCGGYIDGPDVVLLSREASGRLKRTTVPAEWVAYLRSSELPGDMRRQLARAARSEKAEGEWLRYAFGDPETRRSIFFQEQRRDRYTGATAVNPFVAAKIPHYEADVDPLRRLFTDTGAQIQRPRRAYLDLETDSRLPFSRKREMRVLCWALVDDQGSTAEQGVLKVRPRRNVAVGILRDFSDGAEAQLLGELWEALAPYDQVCAWNGGEPDADGDGFDFPVLMARSEHCNVAADVRRLLFVDQMVAFKRMNMHVGTGDEKRSMKLQDIAMSKLGRGKKDFDASKTYEAWAAGGERRRGLVSYCIEDTALLPDIERKTGYLDLFAAICEVCRLFPTTQSLNPTRQLDGFLLRLARERGQHFPSRVFRGNEELEDQQQFKGAYVLHPRSVAGDDAKWSAEKAAAWRAKEGMTNGIVRDVHVCDFASLYPSIILTWNMSADTKAMNAPVNGPIPEGLCRSPLTGVSFRTDTKGMLADAVATLIRLRKEWNDKKAALPPGTPEWADADGRSMAYKVAANSFYGVLGSAYSRYYDRQIAESVTQNGVWLLQQTIGAAEARGWTVVYGDTDSAFVRGPSKEEFEAFTAWCNKELYPGLLKKLGCVENHISLAYEKQFDRIVFAAAKRYCGRFVHYKGKAAAKDSKPEVKGFEFKRGDVSLLAQQLQKRAVHMLMDGKEDMETFHRFIADARQAILEGELPLDQIRLSKSLNKSLGKWDPKKEKWLDTEGSYATKTKGDGTEAAQPPHVIVAKVLAARGQDVSAGTRIEYVVVDAENEDPAKRIIPAEDFVGECDRHYVWESMVYPPTQRLLTAAFPDDARHWEAWSRSRPPRARARAKVLPGQEGLFGAEVETRVSTRARPEPPLPGAASRGA